MLVVSLFLVTAAIPGMTADPKPAADEKVLFLVKGIDDEGLDGKEINVAEAEIESFVVQVQEFKAWIEEFRPFKDLEITEQEKTEIKGRIESLVISLNVILQAKGIEPLDFNWLSRELWEDEFGRSTIVSIGSGYSFIPFYEYETFYGVQIRPMWIFYPPLLLGGGGYTGNLNVNLIPPRVEYGDRLGCHVVRTTMFTGLYMNIGDLGYNKIIGGLVILIGQARVVM